MRCSRKSSASRLLFSASQIDEERQEILSATPQPSKGSARSPFPLHLSCWLLIAQIQPGLLSSPAALVRGCPRRHSSASGCFRHEGEQQKLWNKKCFGVRAPSCEGSEEPRLSGSLGQCPWKVKGKPPSLAEMEMMEESKLTVNEKASSESEKGPTGRLMVPPGRCFGQKASCAGPEGGEVAVILARGLCPRWHSENICWEEGTSTRNVAFYPRGEAACGHSRHSRALRRGPPPRVSSRLSRANPDLSPVSKQTALEQIQNRSY